MLPNVYAILKLSVRRASCECKNDDGSGVYKRSALLECACEYPSRSFYHGTRGLFDRESSCLAGWMAKDDTFLALSTCTL